MHLKWIVLSAKQNLKSITFWMLLASFILLSGLLRFLSARLTETDRVLFCTGDSAKAAVIMATLAGSSYHGFEFEEVTDPDEMQEEIYRSAALAGIDFTDRFEEALKTGEIKESVILYSAPDSAATVALKELLFPCILEQSSPAMLSSYMKENGVPEDLQAAALATDAKLTSTWDIGLFKLTEVPAKTSPAGQQHSYTALLYIILFGMVFFMTVYEEMKTSRAFFTAQCRSDRICLLLESALVRTALLAVFSCLFRIPVS